VSVLASDRKESKHESIIFAMKLQTRLTDFANRDFGIKDLKHFIQLRYAYGKDDVENFSKYRYLLQDCKTQLNRTAALLTANLVAAKSIYPTALHECDQRREYQNNAIGNASQLLTILQRTVDIFNVDVNAYEPYVKDINREIELIKKWRQRDNKIRTHFNG